MVKTDYGIEFPDYHPSPLAPQIQGMPAHWRDDVSGQCQEAMMAYLECKLNLRHLQIVAAFLQYHINAPVWEGNGFDLELLELRERAKNLNTDDDVARFLDAAMEIGLDPI